MIVTAIRGEQVENMLHAIGYKAKNVKRGKYIAFRNHYTTNDSEPQWDKVVESGHAAVKDFGEGFINPKAKMYSVTRKGLDFLEGVIGAKIIEDF